MDKEIENSEELYELIEKIVKGIKEETWPVPFVLMELANSLAFIVHTTAHDPYASMNDLYRMLGESFYNCIENHEEMSGVNFEKRKKNIKEK